MSYGSQLVLWMFIVSPWMVTATCTKVRTETGSSRNIARMLAERKVDIASNLQSSNRGKVNIQRFPGSYSLKQLISLFFFFFLLNCISKLVSKNIRDPTIHDPTKKS